MPKTATGLNETVRYGGLDFHVQTEHLSNASEQHVVTHVFIGGAVVAARRSVYSSGSAIAGPDSIVRAIKQQHQGLVRELSSGDFDRRIFETPGTGEFRPVPSLRTAKALSEETAEAREAAEHFRRGATLLEIVAEHWQTAAQLVPDNTHYSKAYALMEKLIQSVSAVVKQNRSSALTADVVPMTEEGEPRPRASSGTASQATPPPLPAVDATSEPQSVVPPPLPQGQVSSAAYEAAAHCERGLEALQRGEYETALFHWQHAARLDPDNPRYSAGLRKLRQRARSESRSGVESKQPGSDDRHSRVTAASIPATSADAHIDGASDADVLSTTRSHRR